MEDVETQQPQNTPFNTNPEMVPKKEGSKGALIGSIIVVLLLLVAGGYVWMNRPVGETTDDKMMEDASNIKSLPDEALLELQKQGASDEINSIEADVNTTNLEGIDTEINAIDQELKAEGL